MGFDVTDVQKALKGADYPADGDDLADLADSNGASQELVDAIRGIGEAETPADVMKELEGELGDDDE
jgi:hypothetical protein